MLCLQTIPQLVSQLLLGRNKSENSSVALPGSIRSSQNYCIISNFHVFNVKMMHINFAFGHTMTVEQDKQDCNAITNTYLLLNE